MLGIKEDNNGGLNFFPTKIAGVQKHFLCLLADVSESQNHSLDSCRKQDACSCNCFMKSSNLKLTGVPETVKLMKNESTHHPLRDACNFTELSSYLNCY